jgi:hypothetical protein
VEISGAGVAFGSKRDLNRFCFGGSDGSRADWQLSDDRGRTAVVRQSGVPTERPARVRRDRAAGASFEVGNHRVMKNLYFRVLRLTIGGFIALFAVIFVAAWSLDHWRGWIFFATLGSSTKPR